MTAKRPITNGAQFKSDGAKAAPPKEKELPRAGGSYVRQADGALKRVTSQAKETGDGAS